VNPAVVRFALVVLQVLWLSLTTLVAVAQPAPSPAPEREPTEEELAAARALFGEAKELERTGNWAGALAKLEKVAQVKMTPQVRFHLALCHEHLGRMVEAINGFELAEQEARALGDKARDVLEKAPERAALLRKRVAHVRLRVRGTIRRSKIYINDREISRALLDTDIPVDPGRHAVEVMRDDRVTYEYELNLGEGESGSVTLPIDDPLPPPDPVPGDPQPDPSPEPRPGEAPKTPRWQQQLPAYITGGVGVLMLVSAGVLFGLRQDALDAVAAGCDDPVEFQGCDPDDRETAELGQRYDIASKTMLGIGIGAVVAGGVLWFVLPLTAEDGGKPWVQSLSIAPSASGATLRGTF
jgi:hypothetical protein